MAGAPLAETIGPGSDCHRAYASALDARLDADGPVRAAFEDWTTFAEKVLGAPFRGSDRTAPRRAFFAAACYYDFVVDELLGAARHHLGFELEGAVPRSPIDLGAVQDAVRAADLTGAEALDRTATDLRALSAADVRGLYEAVVPADLRVALGDYHTPRGLADLAVDALAIEDAAAERFLDPGCGSGVFLAACLDRVLAAADGPPGERIERATAAVRGVDRNPFAVRGAALSYVLALAPALAAADEPTVAVPVRRADALALDGTGPEMTVEHLVGNPPWLTWGALPESERAAWRERHVDRLDLFPHEGAAARLGHGNDDLSVSFVQVCLDRYLSRGGDAAVVLKRDALQGPAGRLLRRGRAGDRPVSVERVHDLAAVSPFRDVAADAAVYALAADEAQSFPVATTRWRGAGSFASGEALRATHERERGGLVPVEPSDPASSWIREDAERAALGACAHEIRHGLKDDASDVFGLDRGALDRVDRDLVYPYLKSRHVVKFGLFGHDLRLVPAERAGEDNEAWLRESRPDTYEYLDSHRERLCDRASSWLDSGPFYSVFGLGEYTWAPYKVVWCRLGFKPHFAVVSTVADPDLGERPVVPGDHCMFIACERERVAHFLCALLNAGPYQRALRELGSGKASLSKAVVSRLALPPYPDTETAERLATLSARAHDVVAEHTDCSKRAYNERTIPELAAIRAEIDRLVADRLSAGAWTTRA
ncbi:MAG: N-6 DNA methylase [Haloarculaceae archaeon]